MKRLFNTSETIWNTLLVISVIFAVFILPTLPVSWYRGLFRITYSVIYFAAVFSLQKRSKYLITLFVATLLLEWVSDLFNLEVLIIISKSINIIFFLVIVASLIKQIATASEVTKEIIFGSVAGYLLLGIIFSIFISIIISNDPAAYNVGQSESLLSEQGRNISIPMYYGFVTMTTVGYGDILPLKPYTRSLATFIAVAGQFYMAIIVALLVGKFAAQHDFSDSSDKKSE
jgi:hypothetical protein